MNNNLKYAAIFLAGSVVGGTATYFATRKMAKEHFSQVAAEDIASVKQRYHEKEKKLDEKIKDKKYKEKLTDLGYAADTTGLRPADDIREEVEVVENVETVEPMSAYPYDYVPENDRDLTKPHLISQAEYDDNDEFHKLEIVYYEKDDTLADEDETEIVDATNILGDFDPSNFGHIKSEPDLMLVRSPKLRADYTVTRDYRAYTAVILGFEEPEDKPPIRKMRQHE